MKMHGLLGEVGELRLGVSRGPPRIRINNYKGQALLEVSGRIIIYLDEDKSIQ